METATVAKKYYQKQFDELKRLRDKLDLLQRELIQVEGALNLRELLEGATVELCR